MMFAGRRRRDPAAGVFSLNSKGSTMALRCYRVWMRDGFAGLYDAETEAGAREQAIAAARKGLESCNADPDARENRKAITVDYADPLDD
jgi:hypothetical protein